MFVTSIFMTSALIIECFSHDGHVTSILILVHAAPIISRAASLTGLLHEGQR
jgi:hypothetical protein